MSPHLSPLSVAVYYLRNKRRIVPVVVILCLAVFGITLAGAITGSIQDSARDTIVRFRRVSEILPLGLPRVENSIKAKVRNHPSTKEIVEFVPLSTFYFGLVGNSSSRIYAVREADMPKVMQVLDLELVEGHLPTRGSNEIAAEQRLIMNRGWSVGTRVGSDLDAGEPLIGEYQVSGILKGPVLAGLASREYLEGRPRLPNAEGLLVIPREGQAAALDAFLSELSGENFTVGTYSIWTQRLNNFLGNMDTIVWVLNVVIVTVLSLAVGLLNVVHFLQRMNEFGLLAAIGHSRAFLARRTFTEVMGLTVISWVLGLLLAQGLYFGLNSLVFGAKGIALSTLNLRILSMTLPIPVLVPLFSLTTVLYQLLRMDPVSIIERRD